MIKTVKGPSVTAAAAAAAAEGHLAYQGWCVISLPAELKWAALSGTGQNKKKEKEKKKQRKERGRRTEKGEAERREGGGLLVCMHTKRVGPSTEGAKPPSLPFAKATARHPGPIFPGHARHI